MTSNPEGLTTDEIPAQEMAERPFKKKQEKKLFLDVPERHYLIWKKADPIFNGSSSKAIGMTGVRCCTGMFCELNDRHCFVWHAYGHPMEREHLSEDGPSGVDKVKISRRFQNWLYDKLGPPTELMRDTLFLVTGHYDMENWAVVDGILEWAGVDDPEKWIQQRMRSAGAFIVEEPGKMDSVRYFPPFEAMRAKHPGNWSQAWEPHEEGVMIADGLGRIEPDRM